MKTYFGHFSLQTQEFMLNTGHITLDTRHSTGHKTQNTNSPLATSPCYSVTMLQCYNITVLKCYIVTVLQCYKGLSSRIFSCYGVGS